MDQNLAAAGFQKMSAGVKKRLIVSVQGQEKSGKTHFSLTAPGPIAYFGMDIGEEGVVDKFLDSGKEIYSADAQIKVPNTIVMTKGGPTLDAEKAWEKMKVALVTALSNGGVRTVVVDTATEMWELIRLARFGKLTQVMPMQYGPVNAEMRGLLRAAFESDKNVILIHKVKAEYVNDKRTGRMERAGFSDTGYIVQVNLRTYYDGEAGEFGVEVINARQNMRLCGDLYDGDICTFPMIATMVLEDTSLEDWE